MLSTQHRISTALLLMVLFGGNYAQAELKDDQMTNDSNLTENDLSTCEEQLSKYRRFLLQAIVSFEDVCDAYNARPAMQLRVSPGVASSSNFYRSGMPPHLRAADLNLDEIFRSYQPPAARSDIWAFFKLLMAQFNDVEFANVIRDAVIERCRVKLQLQHDMKRNSVVLGKKQRFHSWGGKRASPLYNGVYSGGSSNALMGDFL